jgi:hypothetical protein
MKRTLTLLFLLSSVFCASADPPCVTTPCPESIKKIGECPDEGCTRTQGHTFDQELNKRKNIQSDDRQPEVRDIRWIKGLEDPNNLIECEGRDELKGMGEGQKITIVAWALTAKKGGPESCNCDLPGEANQDNDVVLVDRRVKNPTLAKDEIRSITAEFTPRVRLKHRNFTRTKLNSLISPTGKLLVRVTGLLMFDSKHFFHPDPPVKRDTDWEIHPILKVEYCPKGKTCRANSDENWKDLDND